MITIPNKIEVTITTQTPIWTGNYDRKMDGVKETGVMGSLRWWYEAILRGFGCYVCDPTEKKDKDKRCNCPACQVFGCTGWARQFRMRWYEDEGEKFKLQNDNDRDYRHDKYFKNQNPKKDKGYYILSRETKKEGGKCKAVFYPQNKKIENILKYLILFLQKWGGFGARPQFGYGIFGIEEKDSCKPIVINDINDIVPKPANSSSENIYPDLRDFFFCEFQLDSKKILADKETLSRSTTKLPCNCSEDFNYFTIETKYRIREALRSTKGISDAIRHFICGEVHGNDKTSSKIFISRVYDDKMLIRGYIPKEASFNNYSRDAILQCIYVTLGSSGSSSLPGTKTKWIEFDPDKINTRNMDTKPIYKPGATLKEKYIEWLQYLIQ